VNEGPASKPGLQPDDFRLATAADHKVLATTLARAFADDPVFRWMLPDDHSRLHRMERLFDLLLRLHGRSGRILTAPDGRAASIWQPPGTAVLGLPTILANLPRLLDVFGRHILRSLAVSGAIEAHMPKDEPFWYLHFVGVEPSLQGQGRGKAMVKRGLQWAEAEGLPTYLETARPENVSLYLGLGFTVTGEWDVPDGPHFWSMLHRPAGAGNGPARS
jgi:GNAT superfamily N-acetyltransferase